MLSDGGVVDEGVGGKATCAGETGERGIRAGTGAWKSASINTLVCLLSIAIGRIVKTRGGGI